MVEDSRPRWPAREPGILSALRHSRSSEFTLFGIQRSSEFSALRNSALFGIQRSSEFSALRNSALFGIQRSSEFSALRNSALFGIQGAGKAAAAPAHDTEPRAGSRYSRSHRRPAV